MAALNFPSSPTLNQIYTANNRSWIWDGTSWVSIASITGGSINNTTIGATTPSTGAFTTLSATGATNLDAGTVSAPGLYLEGETGTGLYRIGANNHGYAVSGSKVLDISSTGLAVTGTLVATNSNTAAANMEVGRLAFTFSNTAGHGGALNWATTGGTLINRIAAESQNSGNNVDMVFSTYASNTLAERMRITSGGVLAVGVSNATCAGSAVNGINIGGGSLAAALGLGINSTSDSGTQYFIGFGRNGSICGQIYSTTTNSTTYATSSDARLKERIETFTDSGRLIDALQPRIWKWKNDGSFGLGFVAQEQHAADPIFEEIGAVLVGDNNAEIEKQWMRSDQPLVPILVAELKSLRARVAQLEAK